MIDTGLNDKVVCVTGANNPHGIGAATAKAFAKEGATVFAHYFRQPDKSPASDAPDLPGEALYWRNQGLHPEPLLEEIKRDGGRAEGWEADLGDAGAALQLIDRVEQTFGSIDVLVNNAAWCEPDTFKPDPPVNTINAERFDRHFAVNARAPALLMAEFGRRHIAAGKRWGRIVNISTDAASGYPDEVSYWASKHALESYSRAAAVEFGPFGITVNIASLGPIQTGWIAPELMSRLGEDTPLGRVGSPEEVADVIVFLASEQARWLTGQMIYVGGGHRMSL